MKLATRLWEGTYIRFMVRGEGACWSCIRGSAYTALKNDWLDRVEEAWDKE